MNNFSTGSFRGVAEDSTVVIPISYIRSANIKLIERKYLLESSIQKDSIIAMQKMYMTIQENINNINKKKYTRKVKRQRYGLYSCSVIIIVLSLIVAL